MVGNLRAIAGGQLGLIEKLTEGLPNMFSGLNERGVTVFKDHSDVSSDIVRRLLSELPKNNPRGCDETDMIVFYGFHPVVVMKTDAYVFYDDATSKPRIRIGSVIYLQKAGEGLEFPSLQGFESHQHDERNIFSPPPDYEFLERPIVVGKGYYLQQKVGIPTKRKPDLSALVQCSIKTQKLADLTGSLIFPDYDDEPQSPLTIDHIKRATRRCEGVFDAWTRLEGPYGISKDPFKIDDEIAEGLVEAVHRALILTVETSEGIAKDYLRFRSLDPPQIRTIGYYGTNLPKRTFENTTQPIKEYLSESH